MPTLAFSRNNTAATGTVAVACPRFVVRVAKCQAASDPTQPPTWGEFQDRPVLAVDRLFFGSTAAGMSAATLHLAPGAPLNSPTERIEDIDPLGHGDRVIVSIRPPGSNGGDEPRWAGYCVGGAITIDAGREGIAYRLVGPEWLWGDGADGGAAIPVAGQVRLSADVDDDPEADVDETDLFTARAYPAVFNPGGRKNASKRTATLGGIDGACWFDVADKMQGPVELTDPWTPRAAAKFLLGWYNEPDDTGVDQPDFGESGLSDGNAIPETGVDGLGLWAALRRVLGPDGQFFVDPVPTAADTWGGFKLKFFKRGEGPAADFVLNPLGTAMADASPSLVRLQASKDTASCVNRLTVLAAAVRHVQLRYWGDQTMAKSGPAKASALQHGWGQAEGKLADYAKVDPVAGGKIVTTATVAAAGTALAGKWADRHVTKGKAFPAYSHVFRLFTWNEAGELSDDLTEPGKPVYGSDTDPIVGSWYAPDLTGIADATGFGPSSTSSDNDGGGYCRERRRLLDTAYLDATADVDGRRRVPPTLYVAAADSGSTDNDVRWVHVPRGAYHVDHERAAVWITVEDVADWQPLSVVQSADEPTVSDYRTFATLLQTGQLRMMLEASITCDPGLQSKADRQATSGSPLVRSAFVRGERSFAVSKPAPGVVASPSGLEPDLADDADAAMDLAERYRAAGERQAVHASAVTCPDWPEQPIGSLLAGTGGRQINLRSGGAGDGPGAQVVGYSILPDEMRWEYVTESRTAELGKHGLKVNGRRQHGGGPQGRAAGPGRAAPALAGTAAEVYGAGEGGIGLA